MPRARPPLPAGPILVVGLVRSGVAAGLALKARGVEVVGVDLNAPEEAGRLRDAGVEVQLQTSGTDVLPRARAVVKSPGVPREAPVIAAALERGIPVIGELELAWRLIPNEFLAVTGTNGKTTTTELIGHIHREAGLPVAVAGNVGLAVSSLVSPPAEPPLAPDATVVCEASSFQLEDTEHFAPEAAALLNIEPDHLDRHGTLARYTEAKLRIFANQGNDDVAVAPSGLGVEDLGGCARRVCFGPGPGPELSDRAGQLWWDEQPLIANEEIRLRGPHNRLNAMAAAAVTLARGLDPDAVREGLRTFAGVAHRLEEVAERDGVLFVNDSKATNVASTLVALRSFAPGTIHLIAGGTGKQQDFTPLADAVTETCASVHLIGEAAGELAHALVDTHVPVINDRTLEVAVRAATRTAEPGDVVLLSPACASFDQFTDFEARGDAFRALAQDAG